MLFALGSYVLFAKALGVSLAKGLSTSRRHRMDVLQHVLNGFAVALQPINLWYTFLGCFLGTIIGVLPGIGPSAGIALLMPVTVRHEPDLRAHHDGRHLLRREVRRLDDRDPDQHAGRSVARS